MEITDVTIYPLEYPLDREDGYGSASGIRTSRTATLVKLETDVGHVGWGESVGPPRSIRTLINEVIADRLMGSDPFDIAGILDEVYATNYHFARNGLVVQALSGIDIACWDLMGKATDRAINELLPGKRQATIDAYASTMYYYADERDPIPELQEAKNQGFTGVKIKIGRGIQDDLERVRIARDTLGDDIAIMVDANANYRVDQAVRSANAIEDQDVTWYEEPVSPENTQGYAEVKSKTNIPIAGGEAHAGPFELHELIVDGNVDIIQPDVCMAGGLTQSQRTVALAMDQSIGITPHNWMSGIGIAASLHFASTLPRYPSSPGSTDRLLFEWDLADNALRTEILESPVQPTNGTLTVPTGPGLGVKPDESLLEVYEIE